MLITNGYGNSKKLLRYVIYARKSSGVPEWGYTRSDITGFYEPDENFYYIQEDWKMRLEGSTIAEMFECWRAHDVHRITKITRKNKTKRHIEISDKMVASINAAQEPTRSRTRYYLFQVR